MLSRAAQELTSRLLEESLGKMSTLKYFDLTEIMASKGNHPQMALLKVSELIL